MEPPTLEATGAVKFIAQEHICCGMCDESFMFCGCKGLGYGLNYIYKGLPCPSPNSTRKQLIKRWCCIVSSSRVNTFRADLWYQNEIDKLVNAMKEREAVLKQMMEDYNPNYISLYGCLKIQHLILKWLMLQVKVNLIKAWKVYKMFK